MIFDAQSMPATGGTFMAAALYAAVSLFITGPVVGERMIIKSGWAAHCPALIERNVAVSEAPDMPMPELGCDAIFGWFGPDGQEYCDRHGDYIDANPLSRMIDDAARQKRALQAMRYDHATAGATSRCDCAASVALEENRTGLALYAGSLRLIAPHGVKTLQSGVERALTNPICAAKG